MTDTDPPNEVDNSKRPADRLIISPDSDTCDEQIGDRQQKQLRDEKRDAETDKPVKRRLSFSASMSLILSVTEAKVVIALDHRRINSSLNFFYVFHILKKFQVPSSKFQVY